MNTEEQQTERTLAVPSRVPEWLAQKPTDDVAWDEAKQVFLRTAEQLATEAGYAVMPDTLDIAVAPGRIVVRGENGEHVAFRHVLAKYTCTLVV